MFCEPAIFQKVVHIARYFYLLRYILHSFVFSMPCLCSRTLVANIPLISAIHLQLMAFSNCLLRKYIKQSTHT